MRKIAVFLMGPPGAGKGTQADFLTKALGLYHIDTGRLLESIVHDPERQGEEKIKYERHLFDSGQLNTPEWVRSIVMEKAEELANAGKGIVFSGSPRTAFEAEGLVPLLEKLYGKKNVRTIIIHVSPETSIFRNTHRRVCTNGHPLIWSKENASLENCPQCGAPLEKRTLDTEEAIRVRLSNYENRTKPALEFIRKRKIVIHDVDGEPGPEDIHKDVLNALSA